MSASASASASASVSTSTSAHAPSLSPSAPGASSTGPSGDPTTSTSPSTLPHSPETLRQIAEARTALEASMHNIGSSLDHTIKSRAQTLHANSAQLTRQEKGVVKATEGLRKDADKLQKVADEGQRRVKELGNVQNWAEMLERDFLLLEETLRLVKNGNRPREGGSGDYEGSDWETSRSGTESWSGSETGDDLGGERDDESIAGDLRRGKAKPIGVESGEVGHRAPESEAHTTMDGIEFGEEAKAKPNTEALSRHVQPQTEHIEETPQRQPGYEAKMAGDSSTATATNSSDSGPSSNSTRTSVSTAS